MIFVSCARSVLRCLLCLVCFVLLMACELPARIDSRSALTGHWQAEGKIAISMRGKRSQASFRWYQQGDNYRIHLYGPLGFGSTWIQKTGRRIQLDNPETGRIRAGNAEALMQKALGWQVPVTHLQYWLRGGRGNDPSKDDALSRDRSTPRVFYEDGWQVEILSWHEQKSLSAIVWPRKISAKRAEVDLLVVIKTWEDSSQAAQP